MCTSTFLRGVLMVLRQAGHAGLVVVLDEVETIQRMPPPTREKSLNALRQLVDMLANNELPGLYLVVTGTKAFFEDYKGLKGAPALYGRVTTRFDDDPEFDNLKAPQVRLSSFSEARLLEVGRRIRDIYPAKDRDRRDRRVSDAFLMLLTQKVTAGFGGKVSLTPRTFLRELVDVLQRVDLHAEWDPAVKYELKLDDGVLTPEEVAATRGEDAALAEGDDAPKPKRRLDG